MGLHVVLYRPEIPANTGNIARTCLATNSTLHLIHPLGFSTDDKMLRRAGLDYWDQVKVKEYQSINDLYKTYPKGTYYFIEDYGEKAYTSGRFSNPKEQLFFVFGQETDGIPKQLIQGKEHQCLKIPMSGKTRSLNLSNSVAIIVYEALRQQKFPNLS